MKKLKMMKLFVPMLVVILVASLLANVVLVLQQQKNASIDGDGMAYARLGGVMERARDPVAKEKLQEYLTQESNKSGCLAAGMDTDKGYYWVNTVSDDQTQVRIKFGCSMPIFSTTFAVYKDGAWSGTEVTNQWDMYGNPTCAVADTNAIAKELAPVCFDAQESTVTYRVR